MAVHTLDTDACSDSCFLTVPLSASIPGSGAIFTLNVHFSESDARCDSFFFPKVFSWILIRSRAILNMTAHILDSDACTDASFLLVALFPIPSLERSNSQHDRLYSLFWHKFSLFFSSHNPVFESLAGAEQCAIWPFSLSSLTYVFWLLIFLQPPFLPQWHQLLFMFTSTLWFGELKVFFSSKTYDVRFNTSFKYLPSSFFLPFVPLYPQSLMIAFSCVCFLTGLHVLYLFLWGSSHCALRYLHEKFSSIGCRLLQRWNKGTLVFALY